MDAMSYITALICVFAVVGVDHQLTQKQTERLTAVEVAAAEALIKRLTAVEVAATEVLIERCGVLQ